MKSVSVKFDKPIDSVILIDEHAVLEHPDDRRCQENELQTQQLNTLCKALEQVIRAGEQSYENLFVSQKEKIIRLSIEIASKILARDIHNGEYEIEKILMEAIEPIPVSTHMIVRLHPTDLETMRQAVKTNSIDIPEKIQFIDDPTIGPAECIVESDQSVIEYLIEEHLKQIETVLTETPQSAESS